MRRGGVSAVEVVTVVPILGILAVILYPALRPRPRLWSQTPMPALNFQNAELQTVFSSLHRELYRERKMAFLKNTRWETPTLKHRKVTLTTKSGLTLRQVLSLVGNKAGVATQDGGNCGTCGYPMRNILVIDLLTRKMHR